MHSCVRTDIQATKSALHRVHQWTSFQLLEYCDSCGGFFWSLDAKARLIIAEKRTDLRKQKRKEASSFRFAFDTASVHEDVRLTRVAMQIAVENALAIQMHLLNQSLSVVYRWLQHFRRELPSSVQVAACQRASVVAVNDTVWVEHRHYLEREAAPKKFCLLVMRICKKAQYTAHHPWSHSFTWMYTCWDHDCRFLPRVTLLLGCVLLGDRQKIAVQSTERFAQNWAFQKLRPLLYTLNLRNILLQVFITVRKAIGEKYSIIVVFKVISERQGVVEPLGFALADVVLEVVDISTGTMPTNLAMLCL